MCGYDIRLDQDIVLMPGRTILASALEKFNMPLDVVGIVHDKSTWARRGISVQNTVIEPGWMGFLTLELLYSPILNSEEQEHIAKCIAYRQNPRLYSARTIDPICLIKGTPIAQVIFHKVDQTTTGYGDGKYQNQERGPQEAR
jgi:dCTP deaminase